MDSKAIVAIELKGFSAMATNLAQRCDIISVTPERVRSFGRELVVKSIEYAKLNSSKDSYESINIGGDTWYIFCSKADDAVLFGCSFLQSIQDAAISSGIFYIKPSIAMGIGNPKLDGDRFLDDDSIETYKKADRGEPFHFYISEKAISKIKSLQIKDLICELEGDCQINWQNCFVTKNSKAGEFNACISSFLLDGDALLLSGGSEIINRFIDLQSSARYISIFGGIVPTSEFAGKEYAKSVFRLFSESNCECIVQNYIGCEGSVDNYIWLSVCREIAIKYPTKFAYSAYRIPSNSAKPMAYHVYDNKTLILLRGRTMMPRFSLSSAILSKDEKVSRLFADNIYDGYRSVGRFDKELFDKYIDEEKINASIKSQGDVIIREIMCQ